MTQIINQLSQIEQTLMENTFDETALDDLEGKLKEIELVITDLSVEKYDDGKIIEILETLLQEIEQEE